MKRLFTALLPLATCAAMISPLCTTEPPAKNIKVAPDEAVDQGTVLAQILQRQLKAFADGYLEAYIKERRPYLLDAEGYLYGPVHFAWRDTRQQFIPRAAAHCAGIFENYFAGLEEAEKAHWQEHFDNSLAGAKQLLQDALKKHLSESLKDIAVKWRMGILTGYGPYNIHVKRGKAG